MRSSALNHSKRKFIGSDKKYNLLLRELMQIVYRVLANASVTIKSVKRQCRIFACSLFWLGRGNKDDCYETHCA